MSGSLADSGAPDPGVEEPRADGSRTAGTTDHAPAVDLSAGDARTVDRSDAGHRAWVSRALRRIEADSQRSADTHLIRFPMPDGLGVDLYLKDESTHVTGSLKHRLARSLFLYSLCNGWLHAGSTVIEASSGSTASSFEKGSLTEEGADDAGTVMPPSNDQAWPRL